MFIDGFLKVASYAATVSPETFFEHTHKKDPYIGAALGGKSGMLLGAIKGKKGNKLKAALVGELAGAAGGAVAGRGVEKFMRNYHAKKLRHYVEDLNLRATPSRSSRSSHED